MLIFRTGSNRIRQTVKAFNRMEADGDDRKRTRERRTGGKRKYGRTSGRMKKAEVALRDLIKAGLAEVIRRKYKPPLIKYHIPKVADVAAQTEG